MSGWDSLFSGIKPVPPDVKAAYKDTHFMCECGGTVIPQSMERGICFSCKTDLVLSECEYEEETE